MQTRLRFASASFILFAEPFMKSLINFWQKLSIAHKLNLVIGVMATLIVGELITLRFAMSTLSAARALVGGESLWSKAQKDAIASLQRYGASHSEKDYSEFLNYLRIPEGDHNARMELLKPNGSDEEITKGFLQGDIAHDDIMPVVHLLRNFHSISYLARAIDHWSEGDVYMLQLKQEGIKYHDALKAGYVTLARTHLVTIKALNEQLTDVESQFSSSLGEGSRWLEHVILFLLTLAVLMVESVGISLAFLTNRSITNRLHELQWLAKEFTAGKFENSIHVDSTDEIGQLSLSVNEMGSRLENSYRDMEKAVEARTAEARNAVMMRDEFLSIASHELRTPLTSLSMELQMLARGVEKLPASEPQERVAQLSSKSLKHVIRLTQLLDELLDLTRIQVGKFEVNQVAGDLVPMLRDVVAKFSFEASEKGTLITIKTPHRMVTAFDPVKLEQVITNLISNAIKYGSGTPVEVALTETSEEVQIIVTDHGSGIPLELQEKVFQRFERVDSDPNVKGLGLGLYISHQIVEAHGGKLTVESICEPKNLSFTSFTVHLKRPKSEALAVRRNHSNECQRF
jgi:signal transduction histidine kinase